MSYIEIQNYHRMMLWYIYIYNGITERNKYNYKQLCTQKNWQYKQQVYSHLIFRTILVFLPSLIKETLKKMARHLRKPVG